MNPHEYIGERVHAAMWVQRVTQKQLAAHLHVAQPTVARKLRGERPWSVEDILGACVLLSLAPADLLPPVTEWAASRADPAREAVAP